MNEVYPDLYCILASDDSQPAAPTFLIVRPEGNIIFGSGQGISEYYKKMEELGPVIGVYIGDRHHGKTYSPAAKYFGAPLCRSNEEAKVMKKKGVIVDQVIEFKQHRLYDDIEVIPTPGHTAGALSYLWTSGEHKVLFIGDTIVPVDGEWKIWVSRKRSAMMLETMEMLRNLAFNNIAVGSGAATGDKVIKLSAKAKTEMVESVIKTVHAL